MIRLNFSSLLFAALALSQACITLVSAAELALDRLYRIQRPSFSFNVTSVDGNSFNVNAFEGDGTIWILASGSSEGLFTLNDLKGGRYLSIVGKVAQGSQIGLAADPFGFRLENVADGTDKYRISPFSAASLTIQKSTCSEELVLQTSPGQGEDEWLFNMLR